MVEKRTAADRAEAAAARAWAAEQGTPVAPTGRLPAGLVAAYRAATSPGAGEDGSGPDWAAAAAQLGADILTGAEPGGEPGDQAVAAAAHPAPHPEGAATAPGPPPPADLEEARARLGGGKAQRLPPWARRTAKTDKTDAPEPQPIRITKAVTDDLTGKVALLLGIPVSAWATVDPICGGAAADNLDPIVRTLVPLLCLSQEVVRFFQKGTTFILLLAFMEAVQPVAASVYQHHWTHTVLMLEDGTIVHGELLPDGSVRWPPGVRVAAAAAGQPAQPVPDYSAYTTQVSGHVPPVHAAG